MMKPLLLAVFFFVLKLPAFGNHINGGEITYRHTGNQNYEIQVKIYRDCGGIGMSQSVIHIKDTSGAVKISLTNQTKLSVRDVSGIAPNCSQQSKCSGGVSPYGMEEHIWVASADLSAASLACELLVTWEASSRSSLITTGQADQQFYLESKLNRCVSGGNSSPVFLEDPVFFLSYNKDVTFNMLAMDTLDADDSFSYHLVAGLQAHKANVTYLGQYAPTRPLRFLGFPNPATGLPGGMWLNPSNGNLKFRPTEVNQAAVVVIMVKEWRKINGIMTEIGFVKRDYTVEVRQNTNSIPDITPVPEIVDICPGHNICITTQTADADTGDTNMIYLFGDIPGASFTNTNGQSNRPTGTFCWTPQLSDARENPYIFYIKAEDNGCPVAGKSIRAISVYVRDSAFIRSISTGGDTTLQLPVNSIDLRSEVFPAGSGAGYWTTLGTGKFSNIHNKGATYTFGFADKTNCEIKLVFHSSATYLCELLTDTVTIKFKEPEVYAGPDQSNIDYTYVNVFGSVSGQPYNEVWTTLGDGTFIDSTNDSTTYNFGPNDMLQCEVKLIFKNGDNSCKQNFDTLSIFRSEVDIEAGTYPQEHSYSTSSVKLNASKYAYNDRQPKWTTTGDGYFTDDTDLGTHYHFGTNDKGNCAVKLVLINQIPATCVLNSDTAIVYKGVFPISAGTNGEWFAGDIIFLDADVDRAHGQSAFWQSSGDGVFSNIYDPYARYIPGSADKLSCEITFNLTSNSGLNCGLQWETVKFSQKVKQVDAGIDQSILTDTFVQLNGSVDAVNDQLGLWSSSGDGYFQDPNDSKTKYYPGSNDKDNCGVRLYFTGSVAANCGITRDSITISQLPVPFQINASFDSTEIDTIFLFTTPVSDHMDWTASGSGFMNQLPEVYYVLDQADKSSTFLRIISARDKCGITYDTFDINPSLYKPNSVRAFDTHFRFYPNPVENVLYIQSTGSEIISLTDIYELKGSKVRSIYPEAGALGAYQFDLSGLTPAAYVLRITTQSGGYYSVIVTKR